MDRHPTPPIGRSTGRRARWLAAALTAAAVALGVTVSTALSSATRVITTVAGNGSLLGSSGDGGPATSAELSLPAGVTVNSAGDLLIADTGNDRVRRVDGGGTITAFAGTGVAGFSGDGGAAIAAKLSAPTDAAVDAAGNVYIADRDNNKIRRVDSGGTITTFAGNGTTGYAGDGGAATSARLDAPSGVAVNGAGELLIADTGNHVVRKVDSGGVISPVAGIGEAGATGDGGAATAARLNGPTDLAIDPDGNLLIADAGNHRVRRVSTGGTITTVAGQGTAGSSGDGGAATSAQLNNPVGVAASGAGRLLIAEKSGHRIRMVDPGGTIGTIAGTGSAGFSGDGGDALLAKLNNPARAALRGTELLVADTWNGRVRKITNVAVPAPPTVSAVSPASPANDNAPRVSGTAESGSTVKLYTTSDCSSAVAASGTSTAFASPGLSASVADNSTTTFYATATDAAGAVSACSSTSVTYVEDSTPPSTPSITAGPPAADDDENPSWSFSGDSGVSFECRLERAGTLVLDYAACTSAKVYALKEYPDGDYVFKVRAFDTAGNRSAAAASSTYSLDRVAPAAPSFTATQPSPGTTRAPEWSFSLESGASAGCRLMRGSTVVSDWAACSSPKSYDLTGEPDAGYTIEVRAQDAAGNQSGAASAAYTLDTAAPAAPSVTSAPASPGNGRAPSWSFSAESGATVECRLMRGATVVSAFAACTSPKGYSLTGEPDGVYTLSLRARDAALNESGTTTSTYELDTTAPAEPVFTATPGGSGFDTTPSWSFTAEAAARLECRLSRGGTVVSGYATCTSPKSYDLSSEPDGLYELNVRAIDAAGNVSTPAADTYQLDTATAATPAITAAPADVSSDATPEWEFTASSAAGFECRIKRGTTVVSDFAPCSSPRQYSLTGEPDGTYTFAVRALDAFGRSGPAERDDYTLDRAGPAAPSIDSAPPAVSNAASAAWGFSGELGATLECRLAGDETTVSDWAACTSPRGYDVASAPDGTYTFSVRATDQAGNRGAAATSSYRRDTVAETPAITKTPGTIGRDATPAWQFQAAETGSLDCELRRGTVVVGTAQGCSSPWQANLSAERDGDYTFTLRAIDEAGNVSAAVTHGYRLDRKAPDPPDITGGPDSPGRDTTPAFRFASADAAAFQCALLRGGRIVREWDGCSSPRTYNLTSDADGDYLFRVRATDAAGNTGDPAGRAYTLDTAPLESAAPPPPPPPPPPAPAPPPPAPPPPTEPAPAAEEPEEAVDDSDVAGAADRVARALAGRALDLAPPGADDQTAVLRAGADAEARAEAERQGSKRKRLKANAIKLLKNVGQAAEVVGEKTAFPFALVLVVAFFLGLQDRIDRNDPKLALAPVSADPDVPFSLPDELLLVAATSADPGGLLA